MREALQLTIKGIVQGVGFRPFVYKIAKQFNLTGWVRNASDAVYVWVEGESKDLDAFVLELSDHAPRSARIKEIELAELPVEGFSDFQIVESDQAQTQTNTLVSADLALCPECEAELYDPENRRYRYPFINCTNCGPRFTIIDKLPYDRANSSMSAFQLCDDCEKEYNDPANRRFHAQPDACFECGPWVSFMLLNTDFAGNPNEENQVETLNQETDMTNLVVENKSLDLGEHAEENHAAKTTAIWGKTREESDAIFAQAASMLNAGAILAVKGLGGFHLVCDAENEDALRRLREGKKREAKPFAVMLPSVEAAEAWCEINEDEQKLLTGIEKPIVLLRKKKGAALAKGLADGLDELGVMLPYTPVQSLLMHDFAALGGRMLVMTSGNLHNEPIVIDDKEALTVFSGIVDAILGNNRPIKARYDDSVVRVLDFGSAGRAQQFVRRARGYAPVPLSMHASSVENATKMPAVLAVGPEQKNTFCLSDAGTEAFVSQHIGDMENAETYAAWLEAKNRYCTLFGIEEQVLATDLHPEYLTSKWASEQELSSISVQHHHAHVVSALVESRITEAALGIAFDGTGYGVDGRIWGGEALLANRQTFERFMNFTYLPMPGGAAAIKEPLRMAYGALWACDLQDHPAAQAIFQKYQLPVDVLETMIDQGINTPLTSSVGRLFDAVSALLDICTQPRYEAEAAIMLEAAVHEAKKSGKLGSGIEFDSRYSVGIVKNTATKDSTAQDTSILLFDPAQTFEAILEDIAAGVERAEIAVKFHNAIIEAILNCAQLFNYQYGLRTVALSGGVFLNRYLMESVVPLLIEQGFTVALNQELPPSDTCVSYGQSAVAYAKIASQTQGD